MAILERIPRRLIAPLLALAVLVGAGVLQFTGANPAESQTTKMYAWAASSDPGMDPANSVWGEANPIQLPLTAQAASYPTGGGSIPMLNAQALHFNNTLYVRLEWDDATQDASTSRVQDFSDAAAVEFPSQSAATVPSICMGQANAGVNIWQWRADSEGGPQDPAAVYANSLAMAIRNSSTARDAGSPYAQVNASPVQNLVARRLARSPSSPSRTSPATVSRERQVVRRYRRPFAGAGADAVTFQNTRRPTWPSPSGTAARATAMAKSVSTFVTLNLTNVARPPPARLCGPSASPSRCSSALPALASGSPPSATVQGR
jgi:DMSO reductase family type II enzyme heme b subunit